MGYTWSGPDDVVAFVDPSQEHVAEVNRPDPVGDLLEADRVLLQGMGDEQPPRFQANGAGVGDPLHDEVPGIFDGRQRADRKSTRLNSSHLGISYAVFCLKKKKKTKKNQKAPNS